MHRTSRNLGVLTGALLFICAETRGQSPAKELYLNGSQYDQSNITTNFGKLSCFNWGRYTFSGLGLQCDTMQLGNLGDGGTFYQTGGELSISSLALAGWARLSNHGYGRFSLNGGTAQIGSVSVGDEAGCDQSGGELYINSLNLDGEVLNEPNFDERAGYATYALTGGVLSATSEILNIGYFVQAGGTNTLIGALNIGGDVYYGPGRKYGSRYFLDAGVLVATNISVGGCSEFHGEGGSNSWNINNAGTFSLAGLLNVGNHNTCLGTLAISQGPSPASPEITLGNPSVLRFQDSSSQLWDTNALLIISTWAGSLWGGGSSQLFFGANILGVTAAQLAQIRFTDPIGLPPGSYPARMLGSGEVVPSVPFLFCTTSGSKLILRWAGPFVLQTATDPRGAYSTLSTSENTYTNDLTGGSRFFRLLQ